MATEQLTGPADGAGDGPNSPRRIDPAETYRRINVKRQLQFAKHVLAEKKALELSKKFEEEMEAYWRAKNDAARQRDKLVQDRRFRAVRDSQQLTSIHNRMQAEERNQVSAMIHESHSRRLDANKSDFQKQDQRRQLAQARALYEKDKREKKLEELDKAARDLAAKLDDRDGRRATALRERQEEKKEQADAVAARRNVWEERARVMLSKARNDAEASGDDPPLTERHTEATRRRADHLVAKAKAAEAKMNAVNEVVARKKAMMSSRQDEIERRLEQANKKQQHAEAHAKERAASLAKSYEEREAHREERREACIQRQKDRVAKMAAKNEAKDAKARPTYILAHTDGNPHVTYFKVTQELLKQKERVLTNKEYTEKMIKDAEEIAKAAPYDSRLKRLEELETQLSKHQTSAGLSTFSLKSDQMDDETRKKVYGVQIVRCGLCEQEFSADQLKGVTTVARIEKLRRGWMGEEDAAMSVDHLHASSYDTVKLCVMCLQLVRQHTTAITSDGKKAEK